MISHEWHDVEVCLDCYYYANGFTDDNWTDDEKAEFVSRYNDGLQGWDRLVSNTDPEEEYEGFSWTPCDVCRSHLGGTRYPCSLYRANNESDDDMKVETPHITIDKADDGSLLISALVEDPNVRGPYKDFYFTLQYYYYSATDAMQLFIDKVQENGYRFQSED